MQPLYSSSQNFALSLCVCLMYQIKIIPARFLFRYIFLKFNLIKLRSIMYGIFMFVTDLLSGLRDKQTDKPTEADL